MGGLFTIIANVTVIRGLCSHLCINPLMSAPENEERMAQHDLSVSGADVIHELICGNVVKRLILLDHN